MKSGHSFEDSREMEVVKIQRNIEIKAKHHVNRGIGNRPKSLQHRESITISGYGTDEYLIVRRENSNSM